MSHRVECGEKTPVNAFRSFFGVSFAVASQPQPEVVSTAPPTVVEVPISYVVQTVAIPFDEKA